VLCLHRIHKNTIVIIKYDNRIFILSNLFEQSILEGRTTKVPVGKYDHRHQPTPF